MENLLPYFERELSTLRRSCREFAVRYPKLAGELMMTGEASADPQIEHLIQSTALLNGRIAKLLDDNYSQLTEALLGMLYPHYLRPVPAYSIARVDYGLAKANAIGAPTLIARGTEMKSVGAGMQSCKFKTAYAVAIAPIQLSAACFSPLIDAPPAIQLPNGVSAGIRIDLDSTSSTQGLQQLDLGTLRVFIDGEPSLQAALRDTLFLRAARAYVEIDHNGDWLALPAIPLSPVGFDDDDRLLPGAAAGHPAYRLLTEYFAFPEKFNFFDLDLAAMLQRHPSACRTVSLHLALTAPGGEASGRPALTSLSAANLLLGCTPVINLFGQAATPITLTHTRSAYPLAPDELPPAGGEIYSIDAVRLLRLSAQESASVEFTPYYALRHAQPADQQGHYWLARRDPTLVSAGPRHDLSITFVDRDFDPLKLETGTASIRLTCTNRDLPSSLKYGLPGGDLSTERGAGGHPIRLLRKPSPSYRLAAGPNSHWGLVTHLALNHHTLTTEGLPALIAMLRLYAPADAAVAQRQIGGIVGLAHQPASAWLRDRRGAAYVNGVEVQVALDEAAFVGTSIHAFAQMLDRFFGEYVHLNSFTQLVVVTHPSGKELLRCPPRNGALTLA